MFEGFTKFVKQLGYDLFYENNTLSLSKLTACWGYMIYTWCSIYLMMTDHTWAHYTEFSTYMAGTSTLILTGNKFINSKYNSVAGGFGTSDGSIDGGRTRPEPPPPQSPISPAIEEKMNEFNEKLDRAVEVYEEYSGKAEQISNTINNAKETAGKITDSIGSITGNISIRDGINLASLTKRSKKK